MCVLRLPSSALTFYQIVTSVLFLRTSCPWQNPTVALVLELREFPWGLPLGSAVLPELEQCGPNLQKAPSSASLSHSHLLHGFELAIGHGGPQDVLDGDDVVMLEVFEDLQLPEGPLGIGHHIKSIGDLLNGHLLA